MVGRECAKKEEKNTECFTNPDYYNKSNGVESKTLAIIICVTDFSLLIAFYGLCCSSWCESASLRQFYHPKRIVCAMETC